MFKSLKQREHGKIRMSDQQVFCVRFLLLCDAERWENYQEDSPLIDLKLCRIVIPGYLQ